MTKQAENNLQGTANIADDSVCMNKLIKKKVTTNQIIKFLAKVESYQTRFIEIQLQLASNAKMIVNEYNVGEVEFCNKLKISIKDYDNFIKGGYNYTIEHMSILQSFYVEKSTEKARNEAIKNAEMSFVDVK